MQWDYIVPKWPGGPGLTIVSNVKVWTIHSSASLVSNDLETLKSEMVCFAVPFLFQSVGIEHLSMTVGFDSTPPTQGFISPLYSFQSKAATRRLQHKSCRDKRKTATGRGLSF